MNRRRPETEKGRLPLRDVLHTANRLLGYIAPWKGRLCLIVLAGLLSVGCDLAGPLLIAQCIDSMRPGGLPLLSALAWALGVFAGVGLLSAVLECVQGYWSRELSADVELHLRRTLFQKLTRLPLEAVERKRQGDVMSRVDNDARLAAEAFSQAAVSLLCGGLVVIGCGTIMLWKNAELAFLVMGMSLVSLLATCLASGGLLPRISRRQEALGIMSAHVSESLTSFRSGLEGGRLPYDRRRMEELSGDYYARRLEVCRLEGVVEPLLMLLGNGVFLLLVTRGAALAIEHRITLGAVQAFILYLKLFMDPVNELGVCWIQLQNALSGAQRIFAVLDQEEEADGLVPETAGHPEADADVFLRFEGVGFGYRRNWPVLKDFSLPVRRGEHIAIVGRTGVGKTTLMNLLERFYQSYTGRILLEGREIRDIPLGQLRRRLMLIFQEPQIIEGTILDNLLFGAEGVTPAQARRAAEQLGAAGFIERQPRGYDTEVTAGSLSRGELQLLCLTRAFLHRGDLLLMDEATSSLDTATEARCQQALERMMAGKTCVTIAHRLSTIVRADVICVMEDGRVRELGTHRQLMERRGVYYELFMSQYWGKEI